MKNDRTRISVEKEYVSALGLATFAFAMLEWNAVWCCERIERGYLATLEKDPIKKQKGKTAGIIADDLIKLIQTLPASDERDKLSDAAKDFKKLVETRNGILHGKPGTDKDSGQRLFRNGSPWTVDLINEAADDFTECSGKLNNLLHGFLSQR